MPKLHWRRLDNSAKIFPISTGKRYSTVFRLSAVLKEKVIPIVLEEAVKQALNKYKFFKVRMKARFFLVLFRRKFKRSCGGGRERLSL